MSLNTKMTGVNLTILALFAMAPSVASAQTTLTLSADPANADVYGTGGSGTGVAAPGASPAYVGTVFQTNTDDAIVIPFLLPAGDVITSATFTAQLTNRNGLTPFNIDLSGLSRTSASSAVLAGDYQGAAGFTDPGLFTSADGYVQRSYSGADLVSFLNTQEAAGAGEYVFFRLKGSASAESPNAPFNAYQIETATAKGNSLAPTLSLTVTPAPEPSQGAALGLGVLGLFGLSVRRRAVAPSPARWPG